MQLTVASSSLKRFDNMNGELVSTVTSDFVRLHGMYRSSSARLVTSTETGSVDAAVLVHGLGGNFYSSRLLLHLANTLCELGISVVVVNTRGHDMVNTTTWSGKSQSVGAAFEHVDDAQYDIPAWVEFLLGRDHNNVLVLGHSLGAIKTLYAQAHQPHDKIRALICLSATRLSYQKLMAAPQGELFRDTIQRCENLIDQGAGDEPILAPFPYPTWMTPACYIQKYGPKESFNWLNFIDRIEIPTMMLFGEKELNNDAAFAGIRPELEQIRSRWNSISIEEIPDADHFYTAKYQDVDSHLIRWLTG